MNVKMMQNKKQFSSSSQMSWLRAIVLSLFGLALVTWGAQATTTYKTNNTAGSADDSVLPRTVEFVEDSDFVAGAVVQDVNISVDFEKIDGTCPTHEGGSAFNSEIFMYLVSPSGTQVALVENALGDAGSGAGSTYTGAAYGGPVSVAFDDWAATTVGGLVPTSGTFKPVEALSTFQGETPVGIWTLNVGDSAPDDALCFSAFTLTIDAAQPPVVDDQTFSVSEQSANGTTVGTVLADDSDVGDKLTYTFTAGNDAGIFALNKLTGLITVADGSQLNYEITPSYTLTVTVVDSSGLSDTATITINVNNANETPVAQDDSDSTDEDTVLNIPADGVLANDSDPDVGDTISVTAYDATSTQGAAVTVNANGSFSYNPTNAAALQALAAAASVDDTFTYTISDGELTDTATVTITVAGIDDAPDAVDDSDTTTEETAVTISVLDNDSDVEGDAISIDSVGAAGDGTAVIVGNAIQYTPDADFAGQDSFTYTIIANGQTDTATVTVTVTNVNDAPIATADSNSTDEDTVLNVPADGVLANDSDPDTGDTISVTTYDATSAQGAAVTVDADGSFSYDPTSAAALQALAAAATIDDTFDYTISDGAATDSATVTITVTGVDDAPDAVDDSDSTTEETAVTISVLTNDSDLEGDAISIDSVGTASNGTAVPIGDTIQYTPDADFAGEDSFTYTIIANGQTDTATVTVTVTNVNDTPTAVDDNDSTDEDTVLNVPADGVLGNDTDPDTSDTLTVTAYDDTSAQGAAVTVNANGSFSYDPTNATALQALAAAGSVDDTFTYTISDGTATDSATVTITVAGIDDAPNAVDDSDSTTEETAVTIPVLDNDSDPEGDAISIDSVGTASSGTAVIVGNAIQYTPDADFAGEDSFTYTIIANGQTDTATVTVTVTNQNDDPTDITLSSANVDENESSGTTVGNLSSADPDSSDSFTYSLVAGVGDTDNGSFRISGSELQTDAVFNHEAQGTYAIRIQTRDSGGLTFEKAFTVTVNDINDVPVAVDDTAATDEDTALTVPAAGVLANDNDEDGDTLVVMNPGSRTSAEGASVTIAADGSFSYDPTAVATLQALNVGEVLTDTFSYRVIDGGSIFDTATVSVGVTGVNDAPTAVDDVAITKLETAVIISPLSNDTDPDTTDTKSIASFGQGANGTVTDNGNGTLTYTPATDFIGSDSFTYTMEDGHAASDMATVNVTVSPEIYYILLPAVVKNYTSAPDLVVTSLQASSSYVEVVIENQGDSATDSGFWVDFYVNPSPAPVAANELWPDRADEGIAWGVTTSLSPGETLTLVYSKAPGAPNLYYVAEYSNFTSPLLTGTPIYAQVDSARVGSPDGAIVENHEILGGAYNNIFQAAAAAATTAVPSNTTSSSTVSATLPTR